MTNLQEVAQLRCVLAQIEVVPTFRTGLQSF